jgi:MFS family permease
MSSRVAVTAVFALNGALFASLFSRLPAIQDEVGVSEGRLGLALLCSMAGLLASQPLAGALSSRHGSRPLVLTGALGYSLGLVPIAFADSFAVLCLAFAFIGFASGVLDVSMNVQGLTVERSLGRPILAGLHAAFSFGALAGAAAGGVAAGAGVGVPSHLCAAAGLGVAVAGLTYLRLMPREADAAPEGPLLARPTRALAALGALAFCVLLAEGGVNDWTAIYLDDEVGTGERLAAAELAVFSLTMGIGRLTGAA